MQTITTECGAAKLDSAFLALALVQTGEVAMGFGAYYGCLIESYKFDGCMAAFAEKTMYSCCGKFCNRSLRAFVMLILAALGLSIGLLTLIPSIAGNDIFSLILGQLLPIFFGTFLPFAIGDFLGGKMNLLRVPDRTRSDRDDKLKLNSVDSSVDLL